MTAQTTTHPDELRRRLAAGGPMGFITAVFYTLERLGRPYYVSDCVPAFLSTSSETAPRAAFEAAYQSYYAAGEAPKAMLATPHTIIHQYRKYPSQIAARATRDAPGGARRQRNPTQATYTDRPLPESPLVPSEAAPRAYVVPAFGGGARAPLWDSLEQVPDLIRPHVTPETPMYVTEWHHDVFVDFVCVAASGTYAEQMAADLEAILHTFHHRWYTGATNLRGYHVETSCGAPQEIAARLRSELPARTITWQLRQTTAVAMPSAIVDEIRFFVHGANPESAV